MMTIGRNELCTCGSGKKYKKCCGKNDIVSINQLLENELNEIQTDVFQFSVDMYTDVIEEYLQQYADSFDDLPDDAFDLFDFFARVWVVTSVKFEGKTILQQYIDTFSKKYSRPRTREILQSWKKARPSAYTITQIENSYITVQDIFTKVEQRVRIYETETEIDVGYFLFGTLLPAGASSIFFTTFLELPSNVAESMSESLLELYKSSGEANPVDFMSKHYINVFTVFMFGKPGTSTADFIWDTPQEKLVSLEFENRMLRYGYDEVIVGMGITLWSLYCQRKNPTIKKTELYAAALISLVEEIYPYGGYSTYKELAEEFEVSATSISTRRKDFEKVLAEEVEHYTNLVNELDFELDEYMDELLNEDE